MKIFTKAIFIVILLAMSVVLSSWDWVDKAKQTVKEFTQEVLDGEKESDRYLIKAKLDTLEATVKILENPRLSNQKFFAISNLHLRIAKELHYCFNGFVDDDDEDFKRYYRLTGGWTGGHPHNRNWVSGFVSYSEAEDYEFTDYVFKFDESNQLPTASSKSDNIVNGLLE